MRTALCCLLLCDLVILVLCGCTEHKRETTIEEHTRTVIDRQPVVTPDGPPGSPQPGAVRSEKTETREERIISHEPVAK